MAKQTKQLPQPHNRVVAFIRHGKNLRMVETDEMAWQSIFAGEGIGNGKQKKDVVMAFYLNANDDVIMRWDKPREVALVPFSQTVERSRRVPQISSTTTTGFFEEAAPTLDDMDIFPEDFED